MRLTHFLLAGARLVMSRGPYHLIDRRVANGVLVVVTGVWTVTFLLDVILGAAYDPPPSIQAAFLAVVGLGFGSGLLRG